MSKNFVSHLIIGVCGAVLLSGCQQAPVTQAPVKVYTPKFHHNFQQAIEDLGQELAEKVPSLSQPEQVIVPVDEFFSAQSAEVSLAGRAMQKQLSALLAQKLAPLQFAPLSAKNVGKARWVVLASYSALKPEAITQAGTWVRLQVALVNTATGEALAKAETYLDAKQFDADPARFYKDAPMYLVDARHAEKLAVLSGQKRPLQQLIQIQATFADTVSDYEAGKLEDAVKGFSEVLKLDSKHPGAMTGLYQSNWQLGRKDDAERAFGKLVDAGFDAGTLSFKLLFKVGRSDFIDNADLSAQYRLWLKVVGQESVAKNKCADVNGHASKSGTAEANDRLSLQRAERIVSQMVRASPGARGKFKPNGLGFRETFVGTGADDASDAIDRRVEFKVNVCN